MVASAYAPVDGRLTIQNRTRVGRSNADVHLDGLVVAPDPSCYSC